MANNPDSIQTDPGTLFSQALNLYKNGRLEEAEDLTHRVLAESSKHSDAHQLLGLIAAVREQYNEAGRLFTRAIKYNPHQPSYYYNLGLVLQKQERFEDALAAYEKAIRLNQGIAEVYINRASVLRELGRREEALADCEHAIQLNPDYVAGHYNCGHMLRDLGRLEEAESSYRRALELKPDFIDACCMLANVRKVTPDDNLVEVMEDLVDRSEAASESRMKLGFALGKAYNDLKCYQQAAFSYQQANQLKRETFTHSSENDIGLVKSIRNLFTPEYIARYLDSGVADETPIFILGMPRSGTTLVEQILASHPEVTGAGEKDIVKRLVIQNKKGDVPASMHWLERPAPSVFRAKGGEYLSQLRIQAGAETRYVTDKMPANFWFVGFIRLILPKARIIHVRRDARDTCLSIYTTLFHGDHPYAYDLKELGGYYKIYVSLMDYWNGVFPGVIHEVRYEDLVHDLEGETRGLLRYCELPFDRQCLNFHETRRAVITASFAQVRQPVYRGSVGRWELYKEMLKPLLSELDE